MPSALSEEEKEKARKRRRETYAQKKALTKEDIRNEQLVGVEIKNWYNALSKEQRDEVRVCTEKASCKRSY
jgi:hypothetical protein